MNTHDNACLTPKGREDMVRAVVDDGLSKAAAARQFNTTPDRRQVGRSLQGRGRRWFARPILKTSFIAKPNLACHSRCGRGFAPIASEFGISKASVSRILKRRGLSLLSALEPQEPRPRYERATPGEIIHIDIKKLGRFNAIGHRITGDRRGQSNARGRGEGPGWEFAHVAIDDHSPSRLARPSLTMARIARSGCRDGTRASMSTYENRSPDC